MKKTMRRTGVENRARKARSRKLAASRPRIENLEDRRLLSGTTLQWNGLGADTNWSTAANWTTVGTGSDTSPQAGDTLIFPAGAAQTTNTNDTAADTAYNLQFTGSGYDITGNQIKLDASDTITNSATPNSLATPLDIAADTSISSAASDILNLSGVISGGSGVTLSMSGAGTVNYDQTAANTFTGTTQVLDGALNLSTTVTNGAIVGPLVIGDGTTTPGSPVVDSNDNQIADSVSVTVNSDGKYNAPTDTIGSLTVNGGETFIGLLSTLTVTGSTTFGAGAGLVDGAGTFSPTGGVTTDAGSTTTATISTSVDLGGGTVTFDVADGTANPDLTISGVISNGSLTKAGAGQLLLSAANTYTGTTTINAGALQAGNAAALGTTTGGTTVNTGGQLVLTYNGTYDDEPLTLNGDGGGSGALVVADYNTVTLNGPINIASNALISVNANTNSSLTLGGVISGSANLTLSGRFTYNGDSANTFSGTTTLNAGRLDLKKTVDNGAIAGPLVIGDGSTMTFAQVYAYNQEQIADTSNVTVNSDGSLRLDSTSGVTEVIAGLTLNGGYVNVGSGLSVTSVNATGGSITYTSSNPLVLNGDVTSSGNTSIDTPIDLNGATRTFTVNGSELYIGGGINNSGPTAAGIIKNGAGTLLIFSSSTYSGDTQINAGTLQVGTFSNGQYSQPQSNASIANSTVMLNGGTLAGYGTTGNVTSMAAGGTVSPGATPGILTTGSVSWNAATHFAVELQGSYAGGPAGYDQLVVGGTVDLGGAELDLTTLSPSTLSPSDSPYVILANDGADPIKGLLTLPDGTVLDNNAIFTGPGGEQFRISYTGADGNDITLDIVAAPIAVNDSYVFPENDPTTTPYSLFNYSVPAPGVLSNDTNPNNPFSPTQGLQAVLISGPSHGSLTLLQNGSFNYIPAVGYMGNGDPTVPDDTFTYRATTGEVLASDLTFATATTLPNGLTFPAGTTIPAGQYDPRFFSNLATVDIEINPVNANPVAGSDYYSVNSTTTGPAVSGTGTAGDPYIYQFHEMAPGILANDYSPENLGTPAPSPAITLTPVLVSGPAHGSLVGVSKGGTITDGTTPGAFIYQPNVGYSGTDTFTYDLVDSTGLVSSTASVSLYVSPLSNYVPVGTSDSFTTAEDTSLYVSAPGVLANDTDLDANASLSVYLDANAAHGTVTLSSNGSFTYTPNSNFNSSLIDPSTGSPYGPDTFSYYLTDGTYVTGPISVSVTVTPVPDPIVAVSDSLVGTEDTPLTIPVSTLLVNDSNPDDPNYSNTVLVVRNGPVHGTLSGGTVNPDGTITFSPTDTITYTPDTNYNGPDSFSYYLSNPTTGQTSGSATVSLMLAPVNDPPVANDDTYVTYQNTALTIQAPGVLANDTDPDAGDTLSAILATAPDHGTVTLNPDGSFTYTPPQNFAGTATFTYYANDGTLNSLTPATVTINVVNTGPVANPDSYQLNENSTLTIPAPGLELNDVLASNATPTLTVVNQPLNGTVTANDDGSFTYTPNTNFHGTDSFTYYLTDHGMNSNSATVTLTVAQVPVAPLAVADSYTVTENDTLNVAGPGVLANDTNYNTGSLSAVVLTAPSHGSLVLNSDGSFTYNPDIKYTGSDSFTYEAVSGSLTSDPTTVSLTVAPQTLAPVAVTDSYTVTENNTLNVAGPGVLGNDINNGSVPLSAVVKMAPSHGSLVLNSDGSFTYTPDNNYSGTDTFTYQAVNGNDVSAPVTDTITVTYVNQAPVAHNNSYTLEQDSTLTVPAPGVLGNDTDPDNSPSSLSAVLVNGVQNGTLTLNSDGSFTYKPNPQFSGTDSFTYKAYDGDKYSGVATVTLNVQSEPATTINLATTSDTGISSSDHITRDNTPLYYGYTRPNLTVKLYVMPSGSSAMEQVGTATADSTGFYHITSSVLPDGGYQVFAQAFRNDGTSTGLVYGGPLVVDTQAPHVVASEISPRTGQVYVVFQDHLSGMALPTLNNAGNYSFFKMFNAQPRQYAITNAAAVPVSMNTAPQTVALNTAFGRRIPHGRYLFAALSGGISDVAGNALNGAFNGSFPTGNKPPGSPFLAQFNNNGYGTSSAVQPISPVPVVLSNGASSSYLTQQPMSGPASSPVPWGNAPSNNNNHPNGLMALKGHRRHR